MAFRPLTLPPGATEIARNARASQAFVLGRAVAVQFHPELDPALLELWIEDDLEVQEAAQVDRTHDELRSATAELRDDAARRVRRLVQGFLAHTARQPCPSS